MPRQMRISTLGITILAASWLLAAQPAYAADRALWVWSMAEKIVLDSPAGSKAEFFNFCDSPLGGDSSKKVTVVYLSSTSLSKDLISSYPEEVRGFLAAAHSRGLKVECLDGSKKWATPPGSNDDPPGRKAGENRCDIILNFNKGGASDTERFDGIHYDVEPHGLYYNKGDSYDWDADNAVIWEQYLTLLTNCQAKVDAYNASYTDIKFGVDIAWWYDVDSYPGTPNDVQTRVNYVTLMDYRQTGVLIADGAATELANGNILGKKVYIGVETAPAVPPDPQTVTFFEEGNAEMETQLADAFSKVSANASFGGFAVHYYEDVSAGEWGYRKLWTNSFPGYPPAVQVIFPNGDEGITLKQGTAYNITWTATDRDDTAADLRITIAYSVNGGSTWTNIATDEANDGVYAWNTAGLTNGAQYRVKVIAVDPGGLSEYDISDYEFEFSSTNTPLPVWGSNLDTSINGLKPVVVPAGDTLHMVWYWAGGQPGEPGWGGLPKGVYYRKSADKGVIWGSTVILAEDNTAEPRKPALAVRGDNLAVVWVEGAGTYGNQKIKVRTSADGGDTWNTEEEIEGTTAAYKWPDFPAITIDSNNVIYVVWGARYSDNSYWVLHYNSRSGSVWGGRAEIMAGPDYSYASTPAVTTDVNGVHVVWGEYNWSGYPTLRCNIKYRRKYPDQWTWTSPILVGQSTVTNDVWTKYFPKIYTDSNNKLHVIWQTAGNNPQTDGSCVSRIYYSSSTNMGANWSAKVNLGPGYAPALSGVTGDMRVVYYVPSPSTSSTNDKGDIRYKKSADNGATWSTEATIYTDAKTPYFDAEGATIMGFPYLETDSSGNMAAAWRGYSNEHIMFTYKGEHASPTNLFANLIYNSSNSLKLKWDKPPEYAPNSYSLYRSQNGGAYSLAASGIYDVEYKDTGLSNTNYYKYKVATIEGTTEGRSSNISNALYPGDTFLVDNYEGYEGMAYSKSGSSALTYAYDTSDKKEGNQSMRLTYTYANDGKWGAAVIGAFPAAYNLLDYSSVKFWAKGGTVGKTAVEFQITEVGRAEGNETWKSPAVAITNTDWAEYQFYFSDFVRTDVDMPGGGDFKLNTNSVGSYGLVFDSNWTADGTYYVDGIKLLKKEAFISVPPGPGPDGSYTFGTVTGTIANHRFVAGPIPVSFGGFNENWTIRIWTKNNPSASQADAPKYAGLKGADGAAYIPLKVWCINYGPALRRPPPDPPLPDTPYPDEENDYFWSGYDFGNGADIGRQYQDGDKNDWYLNGTFDETYWGFDISGNGTATGIITASRAAKIGEEPFWLRIPEYNEMDPVNKLTWRRLCYSPGGELSNPFDIYLAIDVQGKSNQTYQTTTLTIEYINE